MKSGQIWMPEAEFHPVTHLFQAKSWAQGERYRAAEFIAADPLNNGIPQTSQFSAGPGIAATGPVRPVLSELTRVRYLLFGASTP